MRAIILVDKKTKEGFVLIPELNLKFKACGLRGQHFIEATWMTEDRDDAHGDTASWWNWLGTRYEMSPEFDISDEIGQFALQALDANEHFLDESSAMARRVSREIKRRGINIGRDGLPADIQAMILEEHRKFEGEDAAPVKDFEKKYKISLQIQKWINDAGGLS